MPATQPTTGTIAASGSANGVILNILGPDTEALVTIAGAFTSAVMFFDASRDGVTFFPVMAVRMSDLATQISDPAGFSTSDNLTRAWKVIGLEQCTQLRVWCYSLGSGSITVTMASGSFFGSSPFAFAVGAALSTTQVLFQLEQMRLMLMWLKEPSGSNPANLAGGGLWSFLGNPSQSSG